MYLLRYHRWGIYQGLLPPGAHGLARLKSVTPTIFLASVAHSPSAAPAILPFSVHPKLPSCPSAMSVKPIREHAGKSLLEKLLPEVRFGFGYCLSPFVLVLD